MANCIRLWDSLFADRQRFDFIYFVGVAIVQSVREVILDGDFANCMESLQAAAKMIPDVQTLLEEAYILKELYEEQKDYAAVKEQHPRAPE